jgi:hypothetical protein
MKAISVGRYTVEKRHRHPYPRLILSPLFPLLALGESYSLVNPQRFAFQLHLEHKEHFTAMAPHQVENNVVLVDTHRASRYVDTSIQRDTEITKGDWRVDSDDDELFDDNHDNDEADSLPPQALLHPHQQQQQRQNTSTIVQFAVAIKRHEVTSRSEYTNAELNKCWYTSEEKQKMNASRDKAVARLQKGKRAKGNNPYRGLECLTQTGKDVLKLNVAKVVDAVMDEQGAQRKTEQAQPNDWDRMAAISQAMTGPIQTAAYQLAAEDERDARLAWDLPEVSQDSLDDESVAATKLSASVKKDKKTRRRKKETKRKTKRTKTGGDPPGKIKRELL